jgi:hypothetical protein
MLSRDYRFCTPLSLRIEENMSDVLVMWRADKKQLKPVEVQCPDGLYPASDSDGEKIYENTHFKTRAECLERLRGDAAIGVRWAGEEVALMRAHLTVACEKAGRAAEIFAAVNSIE